MKNLEQKQYYNLPDRDKVWIELTHRDYQRDGVAGLVNNVENEVERTKKFVSLILTKLPYIPKKVVDIGGGYGGVAINLALLGIATKIIEPSRKERESIKYLVNRYHVTKKNLEILVATAEKLPLIKESVDLVFLIDVLEHVTDQEKSIEELVRILVPGGYAYISCPNFFHPVEQHYHLPYWPLMPKRLFSYWAYFLLVILNIRNHNVYGRDVSKIKDTIFDINYQTDQSLKKMFQKNQLIIKWSAEVDGKNLFRQIDSHLRDNPVKNVRGMILFAFSVFIKIGRILLTRLGILPKKLQYLVKKQESFM